MNEFVTKSIQDEIEALNEESAKMELVLNKFGLLDDNIFKKYDKFLKLQLELGAEECSPECLKMVFLDTKYKLFKKKAELQKYISIYDEQYESMKETEELESEVQEAESHLNNFKPITEKEKNELQNEIDKFTRHLKPEKENLLKDAFMLNDISKKVDEISSLEERIAQLEKEVAVYEGLNPNLFEAKEQLKDVLKECDKLKLKLQ